MPIEVPTDSTACAAVVYNPIKVDIDALRSVVAEEEILVGWQKTLWFETSVDDPGAGATRDALDAGATMIIAAGGDGTIRAIAEEIGDTPDITLALLPSGTGNLLARNLKLTLDDMRHSIHTAFSGEDRVIDLGRIQIRRADDSVSEHAYLVMAGLGLDAKMLAHTDEELKKKVGWLAYLKAITLALRDKNQLRLRYRLDSEAVRSVRAHTVIIGNCGSLQGNVLLMPEAAVDDGLLDILLLRPDGFTGWAQILTKIIWENGVLSRTPLGKLFPQKEFDAINYRKGKKLSLRLGRPEHIELDGDGFGEAIAIRTWVVPAGLTVRVPAESQA